MKRLLIIVASAFAASAVYAPLSARQLELDGYGVAAGINRATMGGGFYELVKDVGGVVNPRYGLSIGGFASLPVAPETWIRPELALTQKGVRVPRDGGLKKRDLDLTYLDVAALVRRAVPVSSVESWVAGGPIVSMKMSATARVSENEFDASDEITGADLGLALEAGGTRGAVDMSLRYILGLSNVSTHSDPDEAGKNRGLQIKVAYNLKR